MELDIVGATYFPKDAHLHPGSLMDGLKKLLVERGVNFEYQTEITGVTKNGRTVHGVVTKDGRTFEGSEVVVCTGAWTPSLSQTIGTQKVGLQICSTIYDGRSGY